MRLILITGIAGTGKTTVMRELVRRGHTAFDTDEDALSIWVDKETGRPVGDNNDLRYGTQEWFKAYRRIIQMDRIREVAKHTHEDTIFMCGVAANTRTVVPEFDKVFCLVLDNDILKRRLAMRTDNDYGKESHQLQDILRWSQDMESDFRELGAVIVDASKSIDEVAGFILRSAIA